MLLLRQAATVGGFTLLSRLLGFVRDLIFAAVLGAGMVADAFVLAQRFPNLFRALFAEGAFSSAFVPLFSRSLAQEGDVAAREFAQEALSLMIPVLLVLTVLVQIFMPQIMLLFAAGFSANQQKFDLVVLYSRIMFPYLLLMALCALYAGILNTLGRFWVAAAAPILFNLVLIIGLVVVAPITGLPGHGQAVCVTISGLIQVIWMAYAAHQAGMDLHLRIPRATGRVIKLLMIALPGTFAAGITQINILIGQIIASWTAGAVTYLYFAERLYQLPLGVIGIAVGAVLLPDLSRRLALGDDDGAHSALNRACEFSLLLTLPATIALIVMPLDILVALFRHGAFTFEDAKSTAPVLIAFACGLPAYVLIKVLTPAFFARQDTRTPVKYAAISVIINIIGSVGFFPFLDYLGIAVATAIAAWVNVALLAQRLHRLDHFTPDLRLMDRVVRMMAAGLLMGIILLFAAHFARGLLYGPVWAAVATLAGIVGLGVIFYGILIIVVGAADRREVMALLRRPRSSTLDGGPEAVP
jgi:putative peptidoglycan lipid II flippase